MIEMLKKVGKHSFAVLTGKITTDSYSTSIKKLALLNEKQCTQIIPARLCAGEVHVLAALEHTFSAIDEGTAFSRKPELEFLIRFFGNRQLKQCLEAAKFSEGEELVLVVGTSDEKKVMEVCGELGFVEQEIDFPKNKETLMKFYNITQQELDTLSDLENALEELVIEKISFVALER